MFDYRISFLHKITCIYTNAALLPWFYLGNPKQSSGREILVRFDIIFQSHSCHSIDSRRNSAIKICTNVSFLCHYI